MENQEVQGQMQLFYTEQELNNSVIEALEIQNRAFNIERQTDKRDMQARAIEWFKSEVRGGSMTDEDALGIYNGLADALGWDTVDSLTTTYRVTVTYKGDEIGEFDVEADDEDSAIEDVRDNLSIEASMDITVEYGGNRSGNSTVDIDAWDISDDLDFEVEEL